ncbi:MAG: flagellar motor protein MotB [Oscillospiraceae bacterium]
MARKRGGSDEEGGSWMDTYGDLVTLILTFFVLLYSMSSIDSQKWQYIAQAFSSKGEVINQVVAGETEVENPTGNLIEDAKLNAGETPENFDELYHYLQGVVQDQGLSESIEVTQGASNVYLKFRDNIFFYPDHSVLTDEGKTVLDLIAPGIQGVDKFILGIRINGHTARADTSVVNDRDLSADRANSVLKYLESKELCPPSKYSASGYGKYREIASNDTEEGRIKNRRVEIVIARNDADYSDPEVIKEFYQMEFGENFVVPVAGVDGGEILEPPPTDIPPAGGENETPAVTDAEGKPVETTAETTTAETTAETEKAKKKDKKEKTAETTAKEPKENKKAKK